MAAQADVPFVTRTHHDGYGGWLCLVRGSKAVWLARPANCWNTGRLQSNETTQDPTTRPEAFVSYGLNAGDALYIPRTWWHYVVTAGDSAMLMLWSN